MLNVLFEICSVNETMPRVSNCYILQTWRDLGGGDYCFVLDKTWNIPLAYGDEGACKLEGKAILIVRLNLNFDVSKDFEYTVYDLYISRENYL